MVLVSDFSVDEAVIVNCSLWCSVSVWTEEMKGAIMPRTGVATEHTFINPSHVEFICSYSFLTHS